MKYLMLTCGPEYEGTPEETEREMERIRAWSAVQVQSSLRTILIRRSRT